MMRFDCDATRDVLPLMLRGESTTEEAGAVSAHLALCGECQAEKELVRVLAASVPPVPAGLEARVLSSVSARLVRRWTPARMALAATVAAAVLGGTFAFERWGFEVGAGENMPGMVFDDNATTPAVSWAVTQDALLESGTSLQQLSVEQLELLLAELDS